MRNELENIEIIEKYLRDELSEKDKKAFEEKLKTDTQLQKEVELQKEVIKGIERIGTKQSIQKAYKKYKWGQSGFNLGLGATILVVVTTVFLWYNSNTSTVADNNILPELNEVGTKEWADADKLIPSQKFVINTANDTVIETQGGIVMYIPQGSFLDDNGNEVNGEVEFEVKEALNAAQIIQAGLSSKSGNRLLESAGMFYVNARKDGKTVQINPENGIYTEVPTYEVKPDMQLFEGKRMADGSIDWINPAPLEKFLTPVDIHSLNFYPPKYESKLAKLGYDVSNKEFKDSLYYSFAWEDDGKDSIILIHAEGEVPDSLLGREQKALEMGLIVRDSTKVPKDCNGPVVKYPNKVDFNSVVDTTSTSSLIFGRKLPYQYAQELSDSVAESYDSYQVCGINPAKIKTIWSNEFNNTLISTREFEERLPAIFGTCNDKVLDLYINNLNIDMYKIDSMAAEISGGNSRNNFLQFATRKDGKVKIDDKRVEKLKKHYEEKQKLIAEAIVKTREKFEIENRRLDEEAGETRAKHSQDELKRKEDNYVEEFNLNLKEAYRQLGKPKPDRLDAKGIYKLRLKTGGWKNVDAYVMESLDNRETLDYTDPLTGKKAVIKYEPISVTIKDESKFNRLLVYILPDQLNSFMRIKKENGVYTEKLNELMNHSLVCLGYIDEQAYFYSLDGVKPKEYSNIKLTPISQQELKHNLNRYDNKQRKSLLKDFDYQLFEVKEQKRQQALIANQKLREEIMQVIFPCNFSNTEAPEIISESPY